MTRLLCLPLLLLVGGRLHAAEPARVSEPADEYARSVGPFLKQHCIRCHGPEKKSGKLALHTLKPDVTGPDADIWRSIRERVKSGEMPPKKEPQPGEQEAGRVLAWIEHAFARAGKAVADHASPLPEHGNRVPHEALFDPKNAALPAATPVRYWRISPYIYAHTDLGRMASPLSLLPADGFGSGFRDYASLLPIDEATAGLLWINAEAAVAAKLRFDDKGVVRNKWLEREARSLLTLVDAKKAAAPDPALLRQIVDELFRDVLKRPPDAAEAAQWVALLRKNIATGGREAGAAATFTALYMHPEFLYRKELGLGKQVDASRRMLSPRELAFAIAYALGDKAPDRQLLLAAQQGKLTTREDVAREVDRLLGDAAFEKPRLLRFFREYFGYASAPEVFKNADRVSHYPGDTVASADLLVSAVLAQDRNVLAELLTTNQFFVMPRHNNPRDQPYLVYGLKQPPPVEKDKPAGWQVRVELPAEERAGLLTHPAWLVAFSGNFDNHAIGRGHWIRTHLLGGTIPDIPVEVDAKVPDDKNKTLRQRMHVTRQEYCWQCHQKMDPLGLPFEQYDHFGYYRTTELGRKVETAGAVTHSGDPALDGPVASPVELVKKLAASQRVEQVFVRHAFRFWMGRNETLNDAGTLQAAHKAYRDSGGSFKALVRSLLTSDSFLLRSGDPAAARRDLRPR